MRRLVKRWYRAYLKAYIATNLRRQQEREIQISERAYENLF